MAKPQKSNRRSNKPKRRAAAKAKAQAAPLSVEPKSLSALLEEREGVRVPVYLRVVKAEPKREIKEK